MGLFIKEKTVAEDENICAFKIAPQVLLTSSLSTFKF